MTVALTLALSLFTFFLASTLLLNVQKLFSKIKNKNISVNTEMQKEGKLQLLQLPETPVIGILKTSLQNSFSLAKLFGYIGTVNSTVALKSIGVKFAIINDTGLAKECFKNPVFAGKVSSQGYCFHAQGEYGLLNAHGKNWAQQRNFLRNLRNFGFGKSSMEPLILSEIDDVFDKMWTTKSKGGKICPNKLFYLPVLNSMWMILTGERIGDETSGVYKQALDIFEDVAKAFKIPECLILLLPLKLETLNRVATWVPFSSGWQRLRRNVLKLRAHLQLLVDSRIALSRNNNNELGNDFVDAYCSEINRTTDSSSAFYEQNGVMNLLGTLTEFFIAGGDTTATMISWSILYLVKYPEIQRQIQNELDSAIGRDRRPGLEDRKNCPFTEAFIWEVLRVRPVTIATTPRKVSDSTNIGPYIIPKETSVILNIIGIHNNPKIWGDPEKFRPKRFLSPDAKTFIKNPNMLAFSTGRRKCPGEKIALDNFFLFVSSICHRFCIERDNGASNRTLNLKPEPQSESDTVDDDDEDLKPLYNGGFLVPKTFYITLHESSK